MKLWKLLVLAVFTINSSAWAGTFERIGQSPASIGALQSSLLSSPPAAGNQRFYATYAYQAGEFDLLSINPATGQTDVLRSPVPGEHRAWSMAAGPEGHLYFGTSPTARFIEFDPRRHALIDRGRPSPRETDLLAVVFGSDGKLYGGTYPNCKLVRYTPGGGLEDLGRLDPTQNYIHYLAASADGLIYAGIGSNKANIAAYNIKTGAIKELLPADAQVAGFAQVYHATDGNIYGKMNARIFLLKEMTATEIDATQTKPPSPVPTNVMADGRTIALTIDAQGRSVTLTVTDPKSPTPRTTALDYKGQPLDLFRVAFGPDEHLYASTGVPMRLVKADLDPHPIEDIGYLGAGEAYSLLSSPPYLLVADYAANAPLMAYTPGLAFSPSRNSAGNPWLVHFAGENIDWRSMAMIEGPDGNIYVGSAAGYGVLDAPYVFVRWNATQGTVQNLGNPVEHESVYTLINWNGKIIGGTSIYGGTGSLPQETQSKLFIWNPAAQKVEFETVPVAGAPSITDLLAGPDGLIYGIAGALNGSAVDTLFVFNPQTRAVVGAVTLPKLYPQPNCAGFAGNILWGAAKEGIFAFNIKSRRFQLMDSSPEPITGGFAMKNGKIYFISESRLYSYTIREAP